MNLVSSYQLAADEKYAAEQQPLEVLRDAHGVPACVMGTAKQNCLLAMCSTRLVFCHHCETLL